MPEAPKFWTINALDPYDKSGCGTIELRLSYAHTEGLGRKRLDPRYARLMLVPEVVQCPTIVLKGWQREGYEDALIYVGKPSKDFRSPTIETPPPKGMVFLVFVTPHTYTISDWRWERADDSDPDLPENVSKRCERVLWPTSPQN